MPNRQNRTFWVCSFLLFIKTSVASLVVFYRHCHLVAKQQHYIEAFKLNLIIIKITKHLFSQEVLIQELKRVLEKFYK